MAVDIKLPTKYKSFEERWEWIMSFMVLEDMFVHEILMIMEKRASRAIPTMAVMVEDARLTLLYNPMFVEQLSDPELRYVVTHEIFHVALHHCTRRLPEHAKERGLWNKAADLAINSLIQNTAARHMPKGDFKGVLPKDFGFPEKLSMEQYIQLLREKGDDGGDGNGGVYGQNGGKCDNKKPGDQQGGFDDHGEWKDSEVIKQNIRNTIEQLSKRDRVWGKMPSDIKDIIMAAQKSQVPWSRYLRHHIGNLITSKMTSTFKRPNRRFGYPYCGTKRLHTDRKLVSIDTSGSIGEDDLAQFLAEVNKLAEIQPVDLQLFDADLQGKTVPFDRRRAKFDFIGRGGTDFEPIMKLAEARRYQSLIILTDGAAPTVERPKYVKDILWVLVDNGNPPVDWGERVHITPRKAA